MKLETLANSDIISGYKLRTDVAFFLTNCGLHAPLTLKPSFPPHILDPDEFFISQRLENWSRLPAIEPSVIGKFVRLLNDQCSNLNDLQR
jgi:hypothetical protein